MAMSMQQMMRRAQKMQKQLHRAQAEVAEMTCVGTAGGGMVTVVAQGDMALKSIEIAPEAVDAEDMEMLQDMVLAAANEALRGVEKMGNDHVAAITGGKK